MHPTNGVDGMTVRLLSTSIAALEFFAAIIFWPAGTIAWLQGWLYFALFSTSASTTFVYLRRVNPEVIEHRLQLKKGTKSWDKLWAAFFTPAFVAIYVVAGFDAVRYEWSTMPLWLWLPGLAIWLPGNMLFTWAMEVNPFFEKTVRIESMGSDSIDLPYITNRLSNESDPIDTSSSQARTTSPERLAYR